MAEPEAGALRQPATDAPLVQLHGDCLDLLPALSPKSVQCVVTSPPYYALRDYGLPPTHWPEVTYAPMSGLPPITIPGCDPDCDHAWGEPIRAPWANENPGPNGRAKNGESSRSRGVTSGELCQRCGGWRGCLGLEPDPLMYVAHLVLIFRHIRAALADDGVCWLNLGDSYAAGGNGGGGKFMAMRAHKGWGFRAERRGAETPPLGTKVKDLLGVPWRVAFALQADGWYLRSDVIWSEPNCMPESANDRPTRAHEYVFLLTTSKRYYYDAVAVAETVRRGSAGSLFTTGKTAEHQQGRASQLARDAQPVRPQLRRAHELAQQAGLTDAHIAAIRASGITDTGKTAATQTGTGSNTEAVQRLAAEAKAALGGYWREFLLAPTRNRRTVWSIPTARYDGAHYAVMPDALADLCIRAGSRPGDTVLDCFGGTGTVARRALALGRRAILMELNPSYLELQAARTAAVQIELDAA